MNISYLQWLIQETATQWWHDSANPDELKFALEHGASGVTTNPILTGTVLKLERPEWRDTVRTVLETCRDADEKAQALIGAIVSFTARQVQPFFESSHGETGYVCAQVNPARAGDRDAMVQMGRRFHRLAPNIAVKLPATSAGLDAMVTCVAEGITTAATLSFTVPQTIAIATKYDEACRLAAEKGIRPGKCFAVMMIGRIDDYLTEVIADNNRSISLSDVQQAGLAITKRSYMIFQQRNYKPKLLVAALRGSYHMSGLSGADLFMSIHPNYQDMILNDNLPRQSHIDIEIPADVIQRLEEVPEFRHAYEPDGLQPDEFISFGVVQRTLAQFTEAGWKSIAGYPHSS